MSAPWGCGTVWYAEDGFGTWKITAMTATEVKCIAEEQETPSFHGRDFSIDTADFWERVKSGNYKQVDPRTGRRPPENWRRVR